MEYLSESNYYKEIMPIHAAYYDTDAPYPHWHPATELFFVLSGEAQVTVEEETFTVQEEDIFLINANDVHLIEGADCKMLSLRFQIDKLPYFNTARIPRFALCSAGNTHAPRYDYVRYLMAQFVKMNADGEHIYKTLSIVFTLYSHLTENFIAPPLAQISLSRKNHERVLTIMEYINDHYTECLTLAAVAEAQNLSVPYLASFFEKNTGKTFLTYYNEIRLTRAVDALLSTDESIESVALANGFSDTRSFVSLFKKKYHTLPSAYRKEHSYHLNDQSYALTAITKRVDEFSRDSIAKVIGIPSLIKYQNIFQSKEHAPILQSASRIIDAGTIDLHEAGVPLRHTHHRLICVGSAKQFLYHEVQEMITKTQQEIHYDYVKFHGILSDDMMVYSETSDGTPLYSFTFVDKVIDFLLSVGLRPLCQLSFMPIALSSDPGRLVDFYHYNTAPPKDLKKWTDLVDALIRHFISRYGLSEVQQWLFCVWNEPDETVNEFSWSDRTQFFEFYCATYRTVKAIDRDFLFGTPSLLLSITEEEGWAADFFRYLRDNNCPPDFLNIHYYDNTLFDSDMRDRTTSAGGFSAENMSRSFPLTVDPYAFMKFINNIKLLLKRYHMKSLPVYLTEWNLTISHRDPINDTCFKSCYLIKNLLENYDRLESFGYWCLTDFIEELQIPNELYHGGLGLFTFNGIPKAHYNAFRFLSYLGDELIGKGDGFFITKNENHIAILLYNYEHYSKLFAQGARSNLLNQDRYALFTEMNSAEFSVCFRDLNYSHCLIKERFINQNYGSSYDAWVRMGAQPLTSEEDLELLRQQSQPGMYLHQEMIKDHQLTLRAQMAPLEVRLIEIEFQL